MNVNRFFLAYIAALALLLGLGFAPNCMHTRDAIEIAHPVCEAIMQRYPERQKACQDGYELAQVLEDVLGENARLKASLGRGDGGADAGR